MSIIIDITDGRTCTVVCRTCANSRIISEMQPIFSEEDSNFECELFGPFVTEILFNKLKIKMYDGMPQKLCKDCCEMLKSIESFIERCENARDSLEKTLKEHIRQVSPEIEFLSIEKIEFKESETAVDNSCSNDENESMFQDELQSEESEEFLEEKIIKKEAASFASPEKEQSTSDITKYEENSESNNENYKSSTDVDSSADVPLVQPSKKRKYSSRGKSKRNYSNSDKKSQSGDDGQFQCEACQNSFKTKTSLHKHTKQVHGVAKHECLHCNAKYNDETKFKRHLKSHNDSDKTYECKFCGQFFKLAEEALSHEKTHSGPKPYLCNVCGKDFSHKHNLKSHIRIHTGTRKYKCTICEKDFLHRNTYILHMHTHSGSRPKPYQCEHCGKHFAEKPALNSHLRTHTGEKPFKCEFCESAFSQKAHLMYHLSAFHSDVTSDKDQVVGKSEQPRPIFIEKVNDDLGSFEKRETNNLPYVCTVCNKAFKLPFKLTKHYKIHTDDRVYSCTQCEKSFKRPQILQAHINGVHLKIRPYTCQICFKTFSQTGSLNSHMITHTGEKPHSCPFCNKSFGLLKAMRAHMRIHTGEKPYNCEICKDNFMTYKSLASHQRIKHKNWKSCSLNELQENLHDVGKVISVSDDAVVAQL